MANLYLTHKCKRGCSFCFARKVLSEGKGNVDDLLTVDEIRQLLEHYSGQIPVLGLLGGEPFIYPYFTEVVQLLWEHCIEPKIFTSATDPLPVGMDKLDVANHPIHFVVNVGPRDSYNDIQYHNLVTFFEKYHLFSALSFTIFDLQADPSFLFDMIDQFKLSRNIRVGIALPIYKGGNQYIDSKDYRAAGSYFVQCARKAAERQITLSMDCGFVACMFDTEELGTLQRLGTHMGFMCGSAIDIGPKLETWNCFPLFQLFRMNALEAETMEDLMQKFEKKFDEYFQYQKGIFPQCETCKFYKRKMCQGGCKSFKSI